MERFNVKVTDQKTTTELSNVIVTLVGGTWYFHQYRDNEVYSVDMEKIEYLRLIKI